MSDHSHHHCDHHHHVSGATSRALAVGIVLNTIFVLVEIGFGIYSNSLSLLADAGHNFSDVIGLLVAWGALLLGRRLPTPRFTFGWQSATILAALANAVLLLIAVGGIAWEAIRRFANPAAVDEMTIIWVALVGVVINTATALMLMKNRKQDLNMHGAYLHMVADAAVSVGVVLAGLGMIWTGWRWLDPAISLVIAVVILVGTWGLLSQSLRLLLHGVPDSIDPNQVRDYLACLPEVGEVHDLHIWAMSTTETALTAHLVVCHDHPGNEFLVRVAEDLERNFGISHATFQIELSDSDVICKFAPDHVV
ncbi:MAG: cation transporter [Oxalobacter sp.]|nr:MAG: cation transporter [Oxalobacter sp.]